MKAGAVYEKLAAHLATAAGAHGGDVAAFGILREALDDVVHVGDVRAFDGEFREPCGEGQRIEMAGGSTELSVHTTIGHPKEIRFPRTHEAAIELTFAQSYPLRSSRGKELLAIQRVVVLETRKWAVNGREVFRARSVPVLIPDAEFEGGITATEKFAEAEPVTRVRYELMHDTGHAFADADGADFRRINDGDVFVRKARSKGDGSHPASRAATDDDDVFDGDEIGVRCHAVLTSPKSATAISTAANGWR